VSLYRHCPDAGSGALLSWDVAKLAPWRDSGGGRGEYDEYDDLDVDVRPQQRRRQELSSDATSSNPPHRSDPRVIQPHDISVLPLPSPFGRPSAARLLYGLSRSLDDDDNDPDAGEGGGAGGGGAQYDIIRQTQFLYDAAAPSAPTLVAALGGNIVVSYDMETQRVRQCLFGHLYDIMDIAAPPPSWRQPNVFATCGRSGDVKLWDVRTTCGSAAVTLTTGEIWQMNAVVLASSSTGGGGGAGSEMGAGMICFAGRFLGLADGAARPRSATRARATAPCREAPIEANCGAAGAVRRSGAPKYVRREPPSAQVRPSSVRWNHVTLRMNK
jgi:hypothetical protein